MLVQCHSHFYLASDQVLFLLFLKSQTKPQATGSLLGKNWIKSKKSLVFFHPPKRTYFYFCSPHFYCAMVIVLRKKKRKYMFLLLRYSTTLNTQHILTKLELLIEKASKAAPLFSLFKINMTFSKRVRLENILH